MTRIRSFYPEGWPLGPEHVRVVVRLGDRSWSGCGQSTCGGECGTPKLVTPNGGVVFGSQVRCGLVVQGRRVPVVKDEVLPEDVADALRGWLWA